MDWGPLSGLRIPQQAEKAARALKLLPKRDGGLRPRRRERRGGRLRKTKCRGESKTTMCACAWGGGGGVCVYLLAEFNANED